MNDSDKILRDLLNDWTENRDALLELIPVQYEKIRRAELALKRADVYIGMLSRKLKENFAEPTLFDKTE